MSVLPGQPTTVKLDLAMPPFTLPARVRPWHRIRLLLEVLAAYGPLLRQMRQNQLPTMVTRARTVPRSRTIARPDDARTHAVRLGAITGRVLNVLPTDGRCLIQALVLTRLLSARSIDSRVVIGVSVADGFSAHAWVEHEGMPVLPAGHFVRLHEL